MLDAPEEKSPSVEEDRYSTSIKCKVFVPCAQKAEGVKGSGLVLLCPRQILPKAVRDAK